MFGVLARNEWSNLSICCYLLWLSSSDPLHEPRNSFTRKLYPLPSRCLYFRVRVDDEEEEGWNWIDWWLPSCKCLLVHYHSLPIQSSSTLLLIIIVFLFLFMNLYREDDEWETFPFWQVPCSFTCSFHSESIEWAFLRTTEWFRQYKPKLMVRRRLCLKPCTSQKYYHHQRMDSL